MKYLFVILSLLLVTGCSSMGREMDKYYKDYDHFGLFDRLTAKEQSIHVVVNGMICEHCTYTVQETADKYENITRIEVKYPKKTVIIYGPKVENLSDAAIGQFIKESGYTVEKIIRPLY